MQKTKRAFIQIGCWLIIWIVMWYGQSGNFYFILDTVPTFIFQASAIALLIWYLAPKLLFKKKYVLFGTVSLVLLILGAYVTSIVIARPELLRAPMKGPEINGPPSPFFINFLLIGIAFMIAILLETFVFVKRQEEETIKNRNEKLQTELKLLKSQINPHFLFNSLNNIYALSVINSDKTQQSISYLSDMLRYVLYECDQELVPLKKEIAYIENYIKLFSLKSSKTYPIKTKYNILEEEAQIAPMLFIPYVENALKHSNIEKVTGTFIDMKMTSNTKELFFEIANNIPNQSLAKDKVGGIGIENVKRRLAILYPERHQLEIIRKKGIFKVTLRLDLDE